VPEQKALDRSRRVAAALWPWRRAYAIWPGAELRAALSPLTVPGDEALFAAIRQRRAGAWLDTARAKVPANVSSQLRWLAAHTAIQLSHDWVPASAGGEHHVELAKRVCLGGGAGGECCVGRLSASRSACSSPLPLHGESRAALVCAIPGQLAWLPTAQMQWLRRACGGVGVAANCALLDLVFNRCRQAVEGRCSRFAAWRAVNLLIQAWRVYAHAAAVIAACTAIAKGPLVAFTDRSASGSPLLGASPGERLLHCAAPPVRRCTSWRLMASGGGVRVLCSALAPAPSRPSIAERLAAPRLHRTETMRRVWQRIAC